MPHAGLYWTSHPLLVPAKLLLAISMEDAIRKTGEPKGFYQSNPSKNRGCQILGDLIPGALDYIIKNYDGKRNFAEVISRRAQASLNGAMGKGGGNEVKRFFQPRFKSTTELVCDSFFANKTMSNIIIAESQSKAILATHRNHAGLYWRRDPNHPESGYLGHAGHNWKRNKGHNNAHHVMFLFFPTLGKNEAYDLEQNAFDEIKRKLGYRPTGKLDLNPGEDIADLADEIMNVPHINRFFNRVKLVEDEKLEEKPRIKLPSYWFKNEPVAEENEILIFKKANRREKDES